MNRLLNTSSSTGSARGADRVRALQRHRRARAPGGRARSASRASPARSPSSRCARGSPPGRRSTSPGRRSSRVVDTARRAMRPARVDAVGADRRQRPGAAQNAGALVGDVVRPADRLDRDRLDDQRLAGHQEAVLLAVSALELGDDDAHGRRRRGIASVVSVPSYLRCSVRFAAMRVDRDALRGDFARAASLERRRTRAAHPRAPRSTSAPRPPAAAARARRRAPCRTPTARRRTDG